MTLKEAITMRHSVRRYLSRPLPPSIVEALDRKVAEVNDRGGLHVQLVMGERRAFTGMLAYGKFSGVENYLVMAGRKAPDLDERIGYYGEQLVLLAQTLGLNTCWVGLSYRRVRGVYDIAAGETLACMIALGYGIDGGTGHKVKTIAQVSNADEVNAPAWFRDGVAAALLAPTAINQQKFHFDYLPSGGTPRVAARPGFSLVGYTKMDLGIARLHFEIGAGGAQFEWA